MLGDLLRRLRPSAPPERAAANGMGWGLEPAAWLALVMLSGTWAWWAWQKGAYPVVGTVFLPGLVILCIGLGLLIMFAPWRLRLRLSTPAVIALSALVGLGCWALLSATWSPAPDIAIANGQRIIGYGIAFAFGVLLCNLLGRRMLLSMAPLAFAGAIVGLITAFHLLLNSDAQGILEVDGTLEYPLGYRNAAAGFFAICIFPAISLAIDPRTDRWMRVAGLATTTLCINLLILAQSRASLPALIISVIVFALVSPRRVRALSWLGLAALAAIPTVPAMSSLFTASAEGIRDVAGEMHTAGLVVLLTTAAAAALGALAVRNEDRLPGLGSRSAASNRLVSRTMIGLAAIGALGFLVAVGNPFSWVGDRVDEFQNAGSPNLNESGTRFGLNVGSNRYDAWRVALSDVGDDPIFGDGGGGFRYSYLEKRNTPYLNLRDAHSVEFEVASELGIVGFGLFAAAIIGAFAGAIRARPLGPAARLLSAAALATGTYWIVHASVDWFWPYPAITAPALALLGSAAAPAVRTATRRSTRTWRRWALAGLAVLSLSTFAPYFADRYVHGVLKDGWRDNPERAITALGRAHDLNRFDDFPLLLKAQIQTETGDESGALATLREAAELRPEEYAVHYLIADLESETNPGIARNEIRVALELNPLDLKVRRLAGELGIPESQLVPLPEG